jgi:hypothetical protein
LVDRRWKQPLQRQDAHDPQEWNAELDGTDALIVFEVAASEEGRFVRLVNIGRNHYGSEALRIPAFEIFGSLIE